MGHIEPKVWEDHSHSSIQAHSMGELFPCVIARIERYSARPTYRVRAMLGGICHRSASVQAGDAEEALMLALARIGGGFYLEVYSIEPCSISWELTAYGRAEEYATREDAEMVARALLADSRIRAQWRRNPGALDYALDVRSAAHPEIAGARDANPGRAVDLSGRRA